VDPAVRLGLLDRDELAGDKSELFGVKQRELKVLHVT
jgi:hypothetical protein